MADRFEILRIADSGGMGVVYQARDRSNGGNVALKVLMTGEDGPAERFASEVEHLAKLSHPHIVGYISHGITPVGLPFLVMPWLEGEDLGERLRREPLSVEDTLTLARGVADALSHIHEQGLVHRDLKPSNLFLPHGRVEDVQVIDLGVARASIASTALTLSGVLIGTPGFIAPEQARGDRHVAPSVDIFALGCVLFECLTGQRLFTGAHVMSVLAKILLEDAPRVRELRPDAPSSLDLLIHRMVAKDPYKRPRDGTQLAQWLVDIERSSLPDDEVPSVGALTASERRVVTVLIVILPRNRSARHATSSEETRTEADPLGIAAGRFGLRAQLLADRTAIVLASEKLPAADQATMLTRFARHVSETFPGASVALTTGSAMTGSALPGGEALDRAVTLVRAADTGVLVDEVTAALITGRFDIRREGKKLIVDAERATLDPSRPLLGRPTSCVGRDRELALLETTVTECLEGDGPKVVLVTAPAGAGKSRLRHELLRRLGNKDTAHRVLHCQGDPLHAATPYTMVAQAARQALGLSMQGSLDDTRASIRSSVFELLERPEAERAHAFVGELLGAPFDDASNLALRAARGETAAMADQIARAFEELMGALCRRQLVVMVLEDLHWCDVASARLLERVLRKLEASRLFVLALARPDVHERFPGLFANRNAIEVHLPPLAKRACVNFVHSVMGDQAPVDVERIVERSEGNAFFLEELIRAEDERLQRHDSNVAGSRPDDLPTTVIALAQARLERLEPPVRKVLRAASVFGDSFRIEGAAALVGETAAAIAPIIDLLIDQEAIVESEAPQRGGLRELAFRHALLRVTAYATLTEEDRSLGHRLAARWLERLEEDGEIVAMHWLEAGDRTRAANSLLDAGRMRWGRAQADVAARCALRSVVVTDGATEDPLRIQERFALLASALGSTRSLDARDFATGFERYASHAREGSTVIVLDAVERVLVSLRDHASAPILIQVLINGACALGALADFANARKWITEAAMRASEDPRSLRAASYAAAKIAYWQNDGSSAVELLADTILPEDANDRFEILLILAWSVVTVDGHVALARALDYISRAEAIHTAAGSGGKGTAWSDPVAQLHCAKARVVAFYLAGDYASGAEAAEEGIALARQTGMRFDESSHLHNAGDMYVRLGDVERAKKALHESNAIARSIGSNRTLALNDVVLAHIEGDSGYLLRTMHGDADGWLRLYASYWLARLAIKKRGVGVRATVTEAQTLAISLNVRTMIDDCARMLAELDAASA